MNLNELKTQIPSSPAFILDEDQVMRNLQALQLLQNAAACKLLYAMKALPLTAVLTRLKNHIDGISVSSLFEAQLAHQVLGDGAIHLTTPGIRDYEFNRLAQYCSHISFNSLSQYQQLQHLGGGYSKGLRINPKLSFADDQRYDPCRAHSKLGVDLTQLPAGLPVEIEGLHFHTVFASQTLQPLSATVDKLLPLLKRELPLKWLNIGGGYLYHSIADLSPLITLINDLRSTFALEVYLEPGKAIVGNAGYLLATVLDRFNSDGKPVLILDTSVNHHPEVFEYQRKPQLQDADQPDEYGQLAILAGSSCMAGDVFGEYRFNRVPAVGDRVLFQDVGAYSLIKANRFNGYPLPDVYRIWQGQWFLVRQDSFADYQRQWGGNW